MRQPDINEKRKELRKVLRQKRRRLSPMQQKLHALRLAGKLLRLIKTRRVAEKRRNRRSGIGLYLAVDGEISLRPLIKRLWRKKIPCLLPQVLENSRILSFAPFYPQTNLVKNCYNILQPRSSRFRTLSPEQLDVLFMPLVGFDKNRNRLGMGGGYYDRTIDFYRNCASIHTILMKNVLLVGVAHGLQQVKAIPAAPWDIKPHRIITQK